LDPGREFVRKRDLLAAGDYGKDKTDSPIESKSSQLDDSMTQEGVVHFNLDCDDCEKPAAAPSVLHQGGHVVSQQTWPGGPGQLAVNMPGVTRQYTAPALLTAPTQTVYVRSPTPHTTSTTYLTAPAPHQTVYVMAPMQQKSYFSAPAPQKVACQFFTMDTS